MKSDLGPYFINGTVFQYLNFAMRQIPYIQINQISPIDYDDIGHKNDMHQMK